MNNLITDFDYSGSSKLDIYEISEHYQKELVAEREEHIRTLEKLLRFKKENDALREENIKLKSFNNNVFKL